MNIVGWLSYSRKGFFSGEFCFGFYERMLRDFCDDEQNKIIEFYLKIRKLLLCSKLWFALNYSLC
jgi:hypothetical protein